MKIESDIIAALMTLSEEVDLTQEGKDALANFVCMVYAQKASIWLAFLTYKVASVLQKSGRKQ